MAPSPQSELSHPLQRTRWKCKLHHGYCIFINMGGYRAHPYLFAYFTLLVWTHLNQASSLSVVTAGIMKPFLLCQRNLFASKRSWRCGTRLKPAHTQVHHPLQPHRPAPTPLPQKIATVTARLQRSGTSRNVVPSLLWPMKEASNDEARGRKKTDTMVVQQWRRSLPSIQRDRRDTDLRANTDPDPGLLALVRRAQVQVGTRVTLSHLEARQLE